MYVDFSIINTSHDSKVPVLVLMASTTLWTLYLKDFICPIKFVIHARVT